MPLNRPSNFQENFPFVNLAKQKSEGTNHFHQNRRHLGPPASSAPPPPRVRFRAHAPGPEAWPTFPISSFPNFTPSAPKIALVLRLRNFGGVFCPTKFRPRPPQNSLYGLIFHINPPNSRTAIRPFAGKLRHHPRPQSGRGFPPLAREMQRPRGFPSISRCSPPIQPERSPYFFNTPFFCARHVGVKDLLIPLQTPGRNPTGENSVPGPGPPWWGGVGG